MKLRPFLPTITLLIIIGIGAALRIPAIGHGMSFHPDERHMVMVTSDMDPRVTLNPKSFAYGSLPYYLNRFTGEALKPIWSEATSYDSFFIIGRSLCVFFGLLAIPLVYLLAKKLYRSKAVALISAALLSFNVLHIQLSHFFTTDVILTTIVLAALLCMVYLVESGAILWFILSGIFVGLAFATKFSALFLFLPLGVTVLLRMLSDRSAKFWVGGVLCLLFCLGAAFIAQPYAVFDFNNYWAQIQEQTRMARGMWRPPYTVQYVGTVPYFYPLKQMIWYTMGLPAAIAVFAGVLFAIARQLLKTVVSLGAVAIRQPLSQARALVESFTTAPAGELILLSWVVGFFAATAGLMVKYPRYLLPLYPEMFIFAAFALWQAGVWLKGKMER